MRRLRAVFVSVLAAAVLVGGVAYSSSLGRIVGTVVDSSGAALPGATLTLALPVGIRTALSDAKGEFHFEGVPPGKHRIQAELTGFTPTTLYIAVQSGGTTRANLRLEVGAMTETVTVHAAPYIQSHSSAQALALSPGRPPRIPYAPGMNTEAYKRIDDGNLQTVADHPFTTVSIDVDTASYANVRRFLLDEDALPPPDAVRIEEMLNYFRYRYPQPEGDHPLAVTSEVARCPWADDRLLVRVGLQAREVPAEETPARNLVFLVDVSGSMSTPDKLPLVKAGLSLLARRLRPQDRVALAVYAGTSGLVLPSTPGDRRAEILAALDRLEAGGSTNGAMGIQLAYQVAQEAFIPGGVNRVVLATDGDFNVGVTNEGELTRLIEEKRKSGVFLSVLGFGTGNLKDATMEMLADRGDGNFSYIDSLAEARKVLVHEAGGTLVAVARDVKVQVEWNPARVEAHRLIGYENRILATEAFEDDAVDAGELGSGHAVTYLFEVIPTKRVRTAVPEREMRYQQPRTLTATSRSDELLTVKVRYKPAAGGDSLPLDAPLFVNAEPAPPTGDLRFAAAVAAFGMTLRDSKHKGRSTFELAARLAEGSLPQATTPSWADTEGDALRAEFLTLLERARNLKRKVALGRR
jgi:Ca-activated chloride channel homolog